MVTAFGEAIDGVDMVWHVTDLSRPQRLSQFEGGQPMALSPDGRTVATIAYSGQTALWNVADPRRPVKMTTLSDGDGSQAVGTGVLPGQPDPGHRPLRPDLPVGHGQPGPAPAAAHPGCPGDVPGRRRPHTVQPAGPRVLPRRAILASATGTDQVTLWNVTDPAHAYRLAAIDGLGDFIQAFTFSPRGNLLAAVTYHGTVLVYSLADPARPARTATVRGLLTRALYPSGSPQPRRRRSAPPAAARPTTRWRSPRTGTP